MKSTKSQSEKPNKKHKRETEKSQEPKLAPHTITMENLSFYKTTDDWAEKCKETFDLWQNLKPHK